MSASLNIVGFLRRQTLSKGGNRQSGAVCVEGAMLLPIFLLLTFGMIQYGILLSAQISLNNAAAIAARRAALAGGTTGAELETVITDALAVGLIDPATVNIATDFGTPGLVQVALHYDLPLLIKYAVPGAGGGTFRLKAQTTAPLSP